MNLLDCPICKGVSGFFIDKNFRQSVGVGIDADCEPGYLKFGCISGCKEFVYSYSRHCSSEPMVREYNNAVTANLARRKLIPIFKDLKKLDILDDQVYHTLIAKLQDKELEKVS